MKERYFNEEILLEKVALGDREAFNQLYTVHIDNVYNYIYLFTKSKVVTEEILQETFVNIWENKEKLAEVTSFKHYVFRSVKNKLINHIRHEKIKNKVLYEISQNISSMHEATDYEITYKEYHRIIQEAVEKLPPKRKAIFKMHIEEGVPYTEIAERHKISVSVVKKQYYKACHFVRRYLYTKGEILPVLLILTVYFITA